VSAFRATPRAFRATPHRRRRARTLLCLRAFFAAVVVALTSLVARSARAQDPPPDLVLVLVAECSESPLDSALFVQQLRVELSGDGVRETRLVREDDPALTGPTLAVIRIGFTPCALDGATFAVRIDDFVTHKRVERTLELDETPRETRLRALAIATSELLRASWAELAIAEARPDVPRATLDAVAMRVRIRGLGAPSVVQAPVAQMPAEPTRPSPRTVPARALATSISASFLVRSFPTAAVALTGGRLSVDLVAPRPWLVVIDAEVSAATASEQLLGTIDVGLAAAGVTLAFLARLGDSVFLTIGPRAAVGASWVSGNARLATTLEGSGAGPVVLLGGALGFDVQLVRGFSARFGLDVQATALAFEARVSAAPVTGVYGATIGLWAGLSLEP